ncbi:MAG: hypothetical protein EXR77_14700 [Myxococcales bacterium]|nr:hypothetical protein [Myxococcales bacterium]
MRAADLGKPIRAAEMEAQLDLPGPVTVDTIVAADLVVSLAGLVNLSHPKAKAAGLVDREEPI